MPACTLGKRLTLYDKCPTQAPILLLSDGHTSRVTMAAVHRLLAHKMRLFLTPPNATELYQALDKLFQIFHAAYKATKSRLQLARRAAHRPYAITRSLAVEIIGHVILNGWVDAKRVRQAFCQVGITVSGLDKFRVEESSLLPEPAAEGVEHDPGLSETKLALQKKKDEFMLGPKPLDSPPRLPGEKQVDYEKKCHTFYKEQCKRLQFSPPDARSAGLLPHARESLVEGEEFQMEAKPRSKRKRKHPAVGGVDLEAMKATFEEEQVAAETKAAAHAVIVEAEAPVLQALVDAGLGDTVTAKAMRAYCRQRSITGVAAHSRSALLAVLRGHLDEKDSAAE